MRLLFDRIADYIRECDKILLLLCLAATGYGCVAVLSATHYTGSVRQFVVQFVSMLLGLGVAILLSNFNYQTLLKRWYLAAVIGLLPVILTFFIGYAPEGTDDKAWLLLPGNISFQPAELLKIAFLLTFSAHLGAVSREINRLRNLLPLCLHGAFPVLLIHLQGDDGTALVFAFMVIAMLYAAGVKLRYFLLVGLAIVIAAPLVFFFVMNPDQQARVLNMFNPEADLQNVGWQQWRGRIALANGGLFGQGLFRGTLTQAANVPEGHNDFIFVSIGEELGMLGCLAVVLLLVAICIRILRVGYLAREERGQFICVGMFAMLAAQTVINLGMCLSILPVIGITLPFFSAGGTSLSCLYLGVGLILSVYMHRDDRGKYLHG